MFDGQVKFGGTLSWTVTRVVQVFDICWIASVISNSTEMVCPMSQQ